MNANKHIRALCHDHDITQGYNYDHEYFGDYYIHEDTQGYSAREEFVHEWYALMEEELRG